MTVAVATALGSILTASAAGMWIDSGVGTSTCGTWTQERRQGGAQAAMDREWAQGFVSGVNYGRSSTPNAPDSALGEGTDGNSWAAFVDNYCMNHPLDTVATAAIALIKELERRAGQ
jgi:hypothetical protein